LDLRAQSRVRRTWCSTPFERRRRTRYHPSHQWWLTNQNLFFLSSSSFCSMDKVSLSAAPLSLEEAIRETQTEEAGAVASFLGVTRNNFAGRKVTRLEYEAYGDMALKEMNKICAQIRAQWKDILGNSYPSLLLFFFYIFLLLLLLPSYLPPFLERGPPPSLLPPSFSFRVGFMC
jgi:hypothetical protein